MTPRIRSFSWEITEIGDDRLRKGQKSEVKNVFHHFNLSFELGTIISGPGILKI